MTLRIRIPLPTTEEHLPFLIATAGHVVLFLVILGVVGPARSPGRLGPTLSVRLAPGQGRGGGATASPRPRVAPRAAPEKTTEKPPARTQAAPKPKQPAKELRGATVQPDQLPAADEPKLEGPPAAEAPPAQNGAGVAAGAEGSIAGGVAGGAGGELGGGADWYVGLVVNRLQDAWRDRPVLPLGASPLRATVSFLITRNGQVSDARIETPSGYAPLDSSVLRAVLSLGRLPPLPAIYRKDQLRAQFVFELTPPAAP